MKRGGQFQLLLFVFIQGRINCHEISDLKLTNLLHFFLKTYNHKFII